jgi:MFS family permease
MIAGCLGSGLLAFVYLYAISIQNVPLAFVASIVMWGMVYQGYNAVFPSFYPELFQTRYRVSAMAIAQNIGTMLTAMLPALFAMVAPPGSDNIPLVVGGLAFFITCVCAFAAYLAPETHRLAMEDLGNPQAQPMEREA